MDAQTVDQNYAALEQQAQQTGQQIAALAQKLQAAAGAGNTDAREWLLDLKEITIGIQQEQASTTMLLQSIHSMVDNHVQAQPATPAYQQQPQYQQPMTAAGFGGAGLGGAGGGMLQRFLGGGMGRAILTGAGFGIGDDLINSIF